MKGGPAVAALAILASASVSSGAQKVTAHADGDDIVGTAATAFTFKDFSMDQPSVAVVLSVADTIKLEYDFHFAPAGKSQ